LSRLGKIFIIAAPSGAGKTSLVNAFVPRLDRIKISVSYTTRPPRPDDEEGIDYHFIDDAEFSHMVSEHAFLEYANVYGYRYGTGKKWVTEHLRSGIDVVLEIDWQGAQQVRNLFPSTVSIFILPPSIAVLAKRLQDRQQDDPQVIETRLSKARMELNHYKEFDYLVVNDDFVTAVEDLQDIVRVERLRIAEQQQEQAKLLADLTNNG